jgi:hypothetical protein
MKGMDVCVYSVFVLGNGLVMGCSPIQGVQPMALCSNWEQQEEEKEEEEEEEEEEVIYT